MPIKDDTVSPEIPNSLEGLKERTLLEGLLAGTAGELPRGFSRAFSHVGEEKDSQRLIKINETKNEIRHRLEALRKNDHYKTRLAFPDQKLKDEEQAELNKVMSQIDRLTRRDELLGQEESFIFKGMQQRSQSAINTTIETSFSSSVINGRAGRKASSGWMQEEALKVLPNVTPAMAAAGKQEAYRKIKDIERRAHAINEATGADALISTALNDEGKPVVNEKQLLKANALFEEKKQAEIQLAKFTAINRLHKEQGIDEESRIRSFAKTEMQAKEVQGSKGEIGTAAKAFLESLANLRKGTDVTIESLAELEKNFKGAAKDGGGGGWAGRAAQWASGANQIFQVTANGLQRTLLDQPLQELQNRAGFAGIANTKYEALTNAAGGSMAAALLMGSFSNADKGSLEAAARAKIVLGAQAAGSVAQIAAGGFQIAAALNPVQATVNSSGALQGGLEGAANALQGGFGITAAAQDALGGLSAGTAQIQRWNAIATSSQAQQKISTGQMQGFYNYATGMTNVARGLGAGGGAMLNSSTSSSQLQRMIAARISPEQMLEMSQAGADSMGSLFNQDQVFTARNLEKAGYGTMSTNMQRMGALTNAGGNNPSANLENVLTSSFTKGLESAKSIDAMVKNTAAMVSVSQGRMWGLDTTAANAALLAGAVNPNDPNKEWAAERARTVREKMNQVGMDVSNTFAGSYAVSRTESTLGLRGLAAINFERLNDDEIGTLQNMSPGARKAYLQRKGIYSEGLENKWDTVVRNRMAKKIIGGGIGWVALPNKLEDVVNAANRGESLEDISKNPEVQAGLAAIANERGISVEQLWGDITSIRGSTNSSAKSKATNVFQGLQLNKDMSIMDSVATQKGAKAGMSTLQGANLFQPDVNGSNILGLGQFVSTIEKQMSSKVERDASTAAIDLENARIKAELEIKKPDESKKGETVKKDADAQFADSTAQFKEAVDKFVDSQKMLEGKIADGVGGAIKSLFSYRNEVPLIDRASAVYTKRGDY